MMDSVTILPLLDAVEYALKESDARIRASTFLRHLHHVGYCVAQHGTDPDADADGATDE